MEFNIRNIVLFLSVITTALSAGLFYGWVSSVIPGTKKIPDQAYLETMQSINREILNPGFFIIFFGALILLVYCSYLQYKLGVDTHFYLVLASAMVYALGTIGTTMLGNVPLNNVMESLDLSSFTTEDFSTARAAFEEKWNNFNLIRTVSAIVSFILILFALVKS